MTGMVWSVGAVLTNGNRPYYHILPATGHLASEQALLFGLENTKGFRVLL